MSEYYRGGTYVGSGVATSATDGTAISTSGTIRVGMFRGVAGVTYALSLGTPLNANEGTSRNFTVTTTGLSNGTNVYWTVAHGTTSAADFVATSGTMTISSNSATGVLQFVADSLTEGAETFTLQIRTGSTSGTVVATSSTFTINDTSLTPPTFQYSLTAPTYYWQDPFWANGISPSSLFWNGAFITAAITNGLTTYTSGGFTYTRGTSQGSGSGGTTSLAGVGAITKAFTYYSVSRA
jgi:hypothetical protein